MEDAQLMGPQLAVQRYLDELLQEATLAFSESDALVSSLTDQVEEANESQLMDSADQVNDHDDLQSSLDDFAEFEAAVERERQLDMSRQLSCDTSSEVSVEQPAHEVVLSDNRSLSVKPAKNRVRIKTDLDSLESEVVETVSVIADKTEPLPWSKNRFECLLFKVGGLKMAVPLVELGGIQKADKENLTPLFGQPIWFMGIANAHGIRIRTVDTARWVMPNHYKGDLKEEFKFVIQLDRSDWGLACEVVAEAITLEPSAVKWRSDRTKRPWLAGTVIEHMCAILDVQGFIELLNDPKNGFSAHLK